MKSDENDSEEKVITTHQIWVGEKIPENLQSYRNEWLNLFPNYNHKFHKDDDLRNLISTHYPKYIKDYDNFQYDIERIDFFRCAMLHYYGGIYIDLDVLPINPLDKWVRKNKIIFGFEPDEHLRHWKEENNEHWIKFKEDKIIGNAIMISPKGNIFWIYLMDYIVKNYEKGKGPVINTGPFCISRFHSEHPELFKDVIITESNIFYPGTCKATNKTQIYKGKTYNYISKSCDIKNADAIHLWEGSWKKSINPASTSTSNSWKIIFIIFLILLIIVICILEYFLELR